MAIVHEFAYFKPTGVDEAVRLLADHERAQVLAGGTDLVNALKDEAACTVSSMEGLQAVVDIKGIAELRRIELVGDRLHVGALVTFSDLIESPLVQREFPLITEVARTVGSVGVRNRATMVGNICSAVPCTDSGPLLCAYDAEIVLRGVDLERVVPISQWFVRPRQTSIRQGEMVTRIVIPRPVEGHAGCFVKLMRYAGEDLAQASVCVLALPRNDYRVAFGAVAPVPIRSLRIEQLMGGHPLSDKLIAHAQEFIPEEIAPITDVRATRAYRMHMVGVMFGRAAKAAVARLAGDGPAYGTPLI